VSTPGRKGFIQPGTNVLSATTAISTQGSDPEHIVVVGGGIIGAPIPFHLASRGAQVVLCERVRPAGGATEKSFAWLNASFEKQPRQYYLLNILGVAVLITHPGHPLAHKESVRIRDLSEESLLVIDASQSSPVADAFERVKVRFHLTVENAPSRAIKRMVALGPGIGFVPLMSISNERMRNELAVISLSDFHQERSVWLMRRRTVQSPPAKAFVEMASEFGSKLNTQGREPLPASSLPIVAVLRKRA
jgi:hypothetical protein